MTEEKKIDEESRKHIDFYYEKLKDKGDDFSDIFENVSVNNKKPLDSYLDDVSKLLDLKIKEKDWKLKEGMTGFLRWLLIIQ